MAASLVGTVARSASMSAAAASIWPLRAATSAAARRLSTLKSTSPRRTSAPTVASTVSTMPATCAAIAIGSPGGSLVPTAPIRPPACAPVAASVSARGCVTGRRGNDSLTTGGRFAATR